MKKICMFLMLTILMSVGKLEASCNDSQMLANDIEYSIFESYDYDDVKSEVEFYGLSDELYLEVTNDYNDDVDVYTKDNFTDGVLVIQSKTVTEKINYSAKVYTTDTSCSNKILRNINFSTNKYNIFVSNEVCNDRYDTIKYCNPFYDVKDMSLTEFINLVNEEAAKLDVHYTFKDYVKMYYLYVLIPFLVISIVYIVRIIIFKRRKKQYV